MPGDIGYGKSVLIALDQLVNTLLGGWPDETFSSRAYRWDISGKWSLPRKVLDWLFFWDAHDALGRRRGHCALSYESDVVTPRCKRGHCCKRGHLRMAVITPFCRTVI